MIAKTKLRCGFGFINYNVGNGSVYEAEAE